MKTNFLYAAFFLGIVMTLPACQFIGSVFKTGVGVGVFIVVIILIAILIISRWVRRR